MTYKRWNDAILNHLFNTADEEVFLMITEEVLDKIGEIAGLGNHNDFLRIFDTLKDPEKRASWFLNEWKVYVGGQCPTDRKIIKSKSLITFATAFTGPRMQNNYPCGYMNILALCLYIINDTDDQGSRALGKKLKNGLMKLGHSENNSYNDIEKLFAHLSMSKPKFRNICINGYPYVGLLRYQLILTPQQEKDIEKALYLRDFYNGTYTDYRTVVDTIFDYVGDDIKDLLEKSFSYAPYRERIGRIIRNFDFDACRKKLIDSNSNNSMMVGDFIYAIEFIPEPHMSVYTTIRSEGVNDFTKDKKRKVSIVPSNVGHIRGCNPIPVEFDRVPSIWESTECCNSQVKISTYNHSSGVIFFSKVDDSLYMETLLLEANHPTFVAVRKDDKSKRLWTKFMKEGNIQRDPREISGREVEDLVGNDTLLFLCEGFNGQFFANLRELGSTTVKTQLAIREQPELVGGLRYPGKIDVFFVNALPFIKLPPGYIINQNFLELWVGQTECRNGVDYRYDVKNDRLHIELIETSQFRSNGNLKSLPIKIRLNSRFTFIIYATLCDEKFKKDKLYSLDKWGELTTDEEKKILIGGRPSRPVKEVTMPTEILRNLPRLDQKDLKQFAISHLLAIVCLTSNNLEMNARQLEECIKYIGTSDIYTKHIIRSLIDLGFLQPSYGNGITKYQALPPIFANAFAMEDTGKGVERKRRTILYGCFTRYFLDKLIEHCNKQGIDIYVKENKSNDTATVIPPILVIGEGFNVEEFSCESWKCDGDLGVTLLEACPTLDDFKLTLKETSASNFTSQTIEDRSINKTGLFSSVGPSYKLKKWYRHTDGNFYHSDVKDFGWIGLHALRQTESRCILVNTESIILLDHRPLPYTLRRAFCAMNIGEGKHIKAFIAGSHPYAEGHGLFIVAVKYDWGADTGTLDILKRILGNDDRLYCGFKTKKTTLTLYTSPEHFCNGLPRYCLEYDHCGCHIKAYWWPRNSKAEVYTKEREGWLKVDMANWGNGMDGIHKIFTYMIKDLKNTWIKISHVDKKASSLYELSNYYKQEIKILEV